MCLIVVAYRCHSTYPLVLAANRDESYQRPSRAASFWEEAPGILAGKDLSKGGTWLGLGHDGRLSAVTNFRKKELDKDKSLSRGELVKNFLDKEIRAQDYLAEVARHAEQYNAFNLLLADRKALYFLSSRESSWREPGEGIYGISNGEFDCRWPKVIRAKQEMALHLQQANVADHAPLLEMLSDSSRPPDNELPDTGVGIEWERELSPIFIQSDKYGTRASTVITLDIHGNVKFTEQSYLQGGVKGEQVCFDFPAASSEEK